MHFPLAISVQAGMTGVQLDLPILAMSPAHSSRPIGRRKSHLAASVKALYPNR